MKRIGNDIELTSNGMENMQVINLAVQYPHSKEVVQDVFDVVGDIEKTKLILDISCQRTISVYPILDLIKKK